MKNPPKLRVYFSDFFGVTPEEISQHGSFNISLINDLPLFIDPFLIFNSSKDEYKILHEDIIKYVRFLKSKASEKILPGLVKSWYHFPEIKENWLGFSKSGNSGRGLGAKFASQLKFELTSIFKDFGEEESGGTHLSKLTLIKGGVGKDSISDFTCNLIKGYLAQYTEDFSLKHIDKSRLQKFNLDKVFFNYETQTWAGKTFTLPRFNGQYILLTPSDILTKDDAWISHQGLIEDFSAIIGSVSNDQLRAQIDNYFRRNLRLAKPRKSDYEKAAELVIAKYPQLLDIYVSQRVKNGDDATSENIEKINAAQEVFVKNLSALIKNVATTEFYETSPNSYAEGMQRIAYLKHVIEKQDGYRIFYLRGKPISREADLQVMFKLTWFASAYSFDAEVNNGRGPSDFLVSYGSGDKSVIEFKLAKNSKLEQNIKNQADVYSDASRATHPPIKVILYFTDSELTKVNRMLDKAKLRECKEIILIDARVKESASKI
ncbi:hypothetical protein [Paracidovorax konjaci]|nr:hypothetical protein [Paracidovorax konjaci]